MFLKYISFYNTLHYYLNSIYFILFYAEADLSRTNLFLIIVNISI